MTVQYVIESVQPEQRTVMVLFFNPHHTGEHLIEVEWVSAEGIQVRIEDQDPNPHVRKLINIPFVDGAPDTAALTATLEAQASSVAQRMEHEKSKVDINPDPNLMLALVGTISESAEG